MSGFLSAILLYFETNIVAKPSFSASWMRCSTRFTGRISPDKPTSPAKQTSFPTAISSLEDNMAATTAKYRDWETDRKSTRLNSSHRL